MLKFEEDYAFEDAGNLQSDMRLGIWNNPLGPEPGPEMPKKRRPSFLIDDVVV